MRMRLALLIAITAFLLPLVSGAQQPDPNPSPSPSPTPSPDCYMPKPDYPTSSSAQTATKQKASAGREVRAATPAKDAVGVVSVRVDKPFPKCAADLSSINPQNPSLSATVDGNAAADPSDRIGSPECLLLGAANSSFAKCHPPRLASDATADQRKAAAEEYASAEKEKLPSPDYAIINLVRWYLNNGKPLRNSSWYLYDRHAGTTSAWKVSDSRRIKGSDEVGFLAVHFGIDDTCGIQYSIEARQRTPTNITDLQLLYKAATSIVPGLPSLGTANDNTTALPNSEKKTAGVDTSSQSQKETIANKVIKNAGPLELNGLTAMFSYRVSPELLPKADASPNEKQLKLSALLPNNPVATWSIARSGAADKPSLLTGLTLKTPDKKEPGAGVYGYASFKGLEKLPYDLTLTGKPDGKPRAVTEKDSQRFAQTLATVYVNPPQGTPPHDDQVAVTWDKDVSVTCAPVPPQQTENPAHASNTFKEMPEIRPAVFRPIKAFHTVNRFGDNVIVDSEPEGTAQQDATASGNSGNKKGGTKTETASDSTSDAQYTSKQIYTNEGLYRWDVSIGVTAFTAKKNTFSASDGTVSKSTSRPENVYVFGDLFVPWKADLVDPPTFRWKPSISFGIPAGSQPLNRSVAGLTFGFNFGGFHFSPFVGSLFLREYRPKTLGIGVAATDAKLKADLTPTWAFRPFVSVNFSVKDAASLIKNKGTSQTKSGSQPKSDKSSKKSGS